MRLHSAAATAGLSALLASLTGCDFFSSSTSSAPPAPSPMAARFSAQHGDRDAAGGISLVEAAEQQQDVAKLIESLERKSNPHRELDDPYFMIGRQPKEWQLAEWANTRPISLADLRGQVTVVRFWTDHDEHSAKSMKALAELADGFRGRGVTFVGVYYSTGSASERDWRVAVSQADAWGVKFPIAYDRRWNTLDDWWVRHLEHLPHSPTLVLGPDGRVAHVHPGPVYYPNDDPLAKMCNDDFLALRAAVHDLLTDDLADRPRANESS